MNEIDKIIVKYGADISEIKQDLAVLKTENSKFSTQTQKSLKDIEQKGIKPLSGAFNSLKQQIALTFSVGAMVAFGREAILTSAKIEGLNTQLKFITGSTEAGSAAFTKIRDLCNKLGLELTSTASAYTKFAGAATQSGLKLNEVDRIFENVAIAAKAMNLSADDTTGIFLALQQMISKGTVAAEELRGQMSERLPGAFSLAAKSIGVTEQQLSKMLEQGQVVARDFLPAFSEQLRETFEGAMGDATESTTSNLNRMQNSWTELKITVGDALNKTVVPALASLIEHLDAIIDPNDAARKRIEEIIGKKTIQQLRAQLELNKLEMASLKAEFPNIENDVRVFGIKVNSSYQDRYNALKLQNSEIEKFIKLQDESNKPRPTTTTKTTDPKELEKAAKAAEKYNKWLDENIQDVGDWAKKQLELNQSFTAFPLFSEDPTAQNNMDAFLKSWIDANPILERAGENAERAARGHEELAKAQQHVADATRDTRTELEKAQDDLQAWGNQFMDIIQSITDAYQRGSDYRLSILQKELESGQITQKQFDRESAKLKRKEAQRDKALAIFNIIIDTARAVVAALAESRPALAVFAGITGAANLASVASTPIPAFKKGGAIKGKEQIIRVNEEGEEFIANAKATRKHKAALEAINKDRFDQYILHHILPKSLKESSKGHFVSESDYRLLLAMKENSYVNKNGFKSLEKAITQNKRHWFQ